MREDIKNKIELSWVPINHHGFKYLEYNRIQEDIDKMFSMQCEEVLEYLECRHFGWDTCDFTQDELYIYVCDRVSSLYRYHKKRYPYEL